MDLLQAYAARIKPGHGAHRPSDPQSRTGEAQEAIAS
jgi:hypothetical protein